MMEPGEGSGSTFRAMMLNPTQAMQAATEIVYLVAPLGADAAPAKTGGRGL